MASEGPSDRLSLVDGVLRDAVGTDSVLEELCDICRPPTRVCRPGTKRSCVERAIGCCRKELGIDSHLSRSLSSRLRFCLPAALDENVAFGVLDDVDPEDKGARATRLSLYGPLLDGDGSWSSSRTSRGRLGTILGSVCRDSFGRLVVVVLVVGALRR